MYLVETKEKASLASPSSPAATTASPYQAATPAAPIPTAPKATASPYEAAPKKADGSKCHFFLFQTCKFATFYKVFVKIL